MNRANPKAGVKWFVMTTSLPALLLSSQLVAQVDDPLLEYSLEDLMDVLVVSASKRLEKTFDAPLSVSVVTQAEIIRAGAITIPEALRLLPGVIVSEIVNGQYDVHVRGLDNMPPGGGSDTLQTSTLLVMVDNRVVYNYLLGRVNWDELSYNINDIDRIEVVRGPASALYGPNAVSGVIHIITNRPETQANEPLRLSASSVAGQHSTTQNRIALEYAPPESHYGFRLSATRAQRDRTQDTYYTLSVHPNAQPNRYQTVDEIFYSNSGTERVGFTDLQYPDPELAVDYTSWNTSVRYDNSVDLLWDLDLGRNQSMRQALAGDSGVSPLGIQDNDASYINALVQWRDFTFQFFENYGDRLRKNDGLPGGEYLNRYNTKSVRAAHDWAVTSNTFLQSEIRYNNIRFIDNPLFNGSGRSEISALALRLDSKPSEWRLIAAINLDYFALLDDVKVTYQFAASRPLSENALFRTSYSHAIRQPFMLEYFLDVSASLGPNTTLQLIGNQDLEFVEQDNIEFAFRHTVSESFAYDVELWINQTKNFSARGAVSASPTALITSYLNLPLEAQQIGFTANFQQMLNERLRLQYFVTLQESQLENVYPSLSVLANPEDRRHLATPTWFGGVIANYDIADDWYLNVNGTFTEARTFVRFRGVEGDTENIYLLNAKLAHQPTEDITIYMMGKNLLDTEKNEFAWTDRSELSILFGFDYRPDI